MGRGSVAAVGLLALLAASAASSQAGVTIFARPTTVGWAEASLLYGTAPGAGPQDVVEVEMRACGSPVWQTVVEAHALSGGGWSAPVAPGVTSTFRAVWRRSASPAVTVRQEARVTLERRRSGRGYLVTAISVRSLWRRQVEIQRHVGRAWRTVKRVRLSDSVTSTGTVSASQANFGVRVPAGTRLRAVLPAAQAAPCYVRSVSREVKA
jgi:hypothetical protein